MTSRERLFRHTRSQVGWFLYDVGASSFSTSVITVFFGPYITRVAKTAADSQGFVHPFGVQISAGAFYPFIISISVILQVILLPFLGAIADHARKRRLFLALAAFSGAGCVASMYFTGDQAYMTGGILFILANLAFGAADVFYNAFLPEICSPSERNTISSTGWGLGYLGGGALLIGQYGLLNFASSWGLTEKEASGVCLLSSGAWWGFFAGVALLLLPAGNHSTLLPNTRVLDARFTPLIGTLRRLRASPHTLLFLLAFLIYSDGIQTVTSISTQFGQEEIGLTVEQLAEVILIVQFVGFVGAFVFNAIAKRRGNKFTIMLTLFIYVLITLYAYGPLSTAREFSIMAACIALVLVGSQALSRSTFSRMIPHGREAEYFGIYEISERGTSWLGPLFFGLALQFSGSYRIAVLALALFFLVGLVLLARVNFTKAIAEARTEEPEGDSGSTTTEVLPVEYRSNVH